jgi:hypothetical protein
MFFASLIMALGVSQVAEPTRSTKAACAFRVPKELPRSSLIGSHDLVRRVRVLPQPDSPITVLSVDVSQLQLNTVSSSYDYDGRFGIRIRNISDRVIKSAIVSLSFWSETGGAGRLTNLNHRLAPGDAVWLAGGGDGGAWRLGHDMEESLELRFAVESVAMDGCTYRPAQARPNRLPGTRD